MDLNAYLAYLKNKVAEREQDNFSEFSKRMDAEAAQREKERAEGAALLQKVADHMHLTEEQKEAERQNALHDIASAI